MPQKLGQHFLKDAGTLEKIAGALDIKTDDVVVEIGPGHGELTEHILVAHPKKVIAIEKDEQLAAHISKLVTHNSIDIIHGDARKILPTLISSSKFQALSFKLVGNIPYYLTGYLLRQLGELDKKPNLTVLLVQKEVAERVCAAPPKMNMLAASVQFWGKPDVVGFVPRGMFSPPPKVDSAILKIALKEGLPDEKIAEKYYKLAKALFKQPRKKVVNNLTAFVGGKDKAAGLLEKAGIDTAARPQDISVEEILRLCRVSTG